mgnify:FL=1
MIELKEVIRTNTYGKNVEARVNYSVKSVFINPSHIVLIKEFPNNSIRSNLLREGKITEAQLLSSVTVSKGNNSSEITVLGSPIEIREKISTGRSLLNG